MSTPVDLAKAYCAELTKAGVRATHDPRKVVAPCVLIAPPEVRLDSMCGGVGSWTAYVLASSGVGNSDAWTQLDGITAAVLPVLPVETVTPGEYRTDEATSFPAFVLTWESSTEWSA